MKNFKNFKLLNFSFIACIAIIAFSSCSNNEDTLGAELTITSISKALNSSTPSNPADNDSITSVGYPNNTYIIRGSGFSTVKNIFFNDLESYFNPTHVTDNVIFVVINQETPYLNVSNEMKLVGINNTAVFSFEIGQPAPEITGFDPIAGGEGDIVTISGLVFDNLIAVRFGDVDAEIVSSSSNEIKVKTPAGIVQENIYVETKGGIGESLTQFGFKFIIFDEALADGFQFWGWGGTQDPQNSEQVKRGTYSIKRSDDGDGGLQLGGWFGADGDTGRPILSDYSAIKVSVYSETSFDIFIEINDDWGDGETISIVGGQWNNFSIPLSEITMQTGAWNSMAFQAKTGAVVYYVDDLGFL